ncbi:MAG: 23S rRNA (uracil(1939)-C(5))-methyltransferase RlmD [Candidatus Uhrbacteria bacterium]
MANKLNQQITGVVESLANDGNGIIPRPIGKPYLVYHTIPGEEVLAFTRFRNKEGIHADLEKVVKSSPHRVEPRCPMFGKCGGCKWQHIDYPEQLKIKLELIKKAFSEKEIKIPLTDVVPCSQQFFYRNRMDFMFGRHGELGLKETGCWWSTLDLPACYLLSEESNEILSRVREWTRASGLPFWDNKKHEGFFRALVIREGKNTGERLITLITNKPKNEEEKNIVLKFSKILQPNQNFATPSLHHSITSILWGVNERLTDLSLADEIEVLKGTPYLHEEINGLKYRISPNSFFQTNSEMATKLQDTVLEFASPIKDKTIADLYCGAGFFTLALARADAKKVIGIEADEAGIKAAKVNAKLNSDGVLESWSRGVFFLAAKIEDYFKDQSVAEGFDTIILDPPRAGLHPKVIETLLKVLPQTIVYISCNFHHLAEELPKFFENYQLVEARALDLFPQTPHVEVVVKLKRK